MICHLIAEANIWHRCRKDTSHTKWARCSGSSLMKAIAIYCSINFFVKTNIFEKHIGCLLVVQYNVRPIGYRLSSSETSDEKQAKCTEEHVAKTDKKFTCFCRRSFLLPQLYSGHFDKDNHGHMSITVFLSVSGTAHLCSSQQIDIKGVCNGLVLFLSANNSNALRRWCAWYIWKNEKKTNEGGR